MAVKIDYWTQGYNGYWDGVWAHSIIALSQLQITNNAEARAEFMRGWNEANKEEKQYGNQRQNHSRLGH